MKISPVIKKMIKDELRENPLLSEYISTGFTPRAGEAVTRVFKKPSFAKKIKSSDVKSRNDPKPVEIIFSVTLQKMPKRCKKCQKGAKKMPKNAEKCQKGSKNAEKVQKLPKNAKKCQKMSKNVKKCQKMPKRKNAIWPGIMSKNPKFGQNVPKNAENCRKMPKNAEKCQKGAKNVGTC